MNKAQAEKRLAALGFEIDWSVTGPSEGYKGTDCYWSGTIDAIGRGQIDGDCRGEVVHGQNAAEWYRNAVQAAEQYAKHMPNSQCTNPDCEFHEAHPL